MICVRHTGMEKVAGNFIISAHGIAIIRISHFAKLPSIVGINRPQIAELMGDRKFRSMGSGLSHIFICLYSSTFSSFSDSDKVNVVLCPRIKYVCGNFCFPQIFFDSQLPICRSFRFQKWIRLIATAIGWFRIPIELVEKGRRKRFSERQVQIGMIIQRITGRQLGRELVIGIRFQSCRRLSSVIIITAIFFIIVVPSADVRCPAAAEFPFVLNI